MRYLRNEWNDGHFDLREWWQLCGKTLAWLGGSARAELGARSCELLGWALWRRWDELGRCCDRLAGGGADATVCRDTVRHGVW